MMGRVGVLGKAEALGLWRRCGSLVALQLRAFEVLVCEFDHTDFGGLLLLLVLDLFFLFFSTRRRRRVARVAYLLIFSAWPRGLPDSVRPIILRLPRLRLPTYLPLHSPLLLRLLRRILDDRAYSKTAAATTLIQLMPPVPIHLDRVSVIML